MFQSYNTRKKKDFFYTLAPESWTIKKTAREFNVTHYVVKSARELKRKSGILSTPPTRNCSAKMTNVVRSRTKIPNISHSRTKMKNVAQSRTKSPIQPRASYREAMHNSIRKYAGKTL